MQRDMAGLKYRSDAHGELLAAGVALLETNTRAAGLVLHASQWTRVADDAAMRTNDAIRPDNRFQPIKCRLLVSEVRFGKNARHRRTPSGTPLNYLL